MPRFQSFADTMDPFGNKWTAASSKKQPAAPQRGWGGWNSLRFPSGWWQSTHGPRGFGREVCGQRREARHGLKGNPTQHWPVGFWGLEQTFRNMENTTGTSMNIAYIFLGNTYENRYETWKHLWNIWNMMICWSGEIHFGNCDLLLLSLLLLGWDGWSLKKLEGARNFVAWSRPGLNRLWGCEVKNQVIRFIGNYSLDGGFKYFFLFLHPYLGKIPILTNISQMGWSHQLVQSIKFSIFRFGGTWGWYFWSSCWCLMCT